MTEYVLVEMGYNHNYLANDNKLFILVFVSGKKLNSVQKIATLFAKQIRVFLEFSILFLIVLGSFHENLNFQTIFFFFAKDIFQHKKPLLRRHHLMGSRIML